MRAIDALLGELDRALIGPRRTKADLLAEARSGLLDAAEAHRADGLDPETAADRAVAEFGSIGAVAPAYQAELGSAQAMRTAVLICLVLAPQDAIWDLVARGGPAGPVATTTSMLLGWLGALALLTCLAAAVATGAGWRLTRAVGAFAMVVASVFTVAGGLLTALGPAPLGPAGIPATVALLVVPMALVARSGRRCLAAA